MKRQRNGKRDNAGGPSDIPVDTNGDSSGAVPPSLPISWDSTNDLQPKPLPYVESPQSPSGGMKRLRQIVAELRALGNTSCPPGIIWKSAGDLVWEVYKLGAFEREDEPAFDKLRALVRSQYVNYSGAGSYADWRGGVFVEAVICLAPQYRKTVDGKECHEALLVIADVIEREIAHIESPGSVTLAAKKKRDEGTAGPGPETTPGGAAEQSEGDGKNAGATPDGTAEKEEQTRTTSPAVTAAIPPEIDADSLMRRIVLCVGEKPSHKTGKMVARALRMPFNGHFKEKLAQLRKMGFFAAGHGYPVSDQGQKIYRALKDREKSS